MRSFPPFKVVKSEEEEKSIMPPLLPTNLLTKRKEQDSKKNNNSTFPDINDSSIKIAYQKKIKLNSQQIPYSLDPRLLQHNFPVQNLPLNDNSTIDLRNFELVSDSEQKQQQLEKQYQIDYLLYKSEGYSNQSNEFLMKICTQTSANKINSKYPLFKMLRNLTKQFFFNDLEIIFLGYYLELNKWNYEDINLQSYSVNMPKNFLYINFNEVADNEQYQIILLYLLLSVYAVKYYLNEESDILIFCNHIHLRILHNFNEIFQYWCKTYVRSALQINPRELNQLFHQFTEKSNYGYSQNLYDYNALVESIIQISTAYNTDKNEKNLNRKFQTTAIDNRVEGGENDNKLTTMGIVTSNDNQKRQFGLDENMNLQIQFNDNISQNPIFFQKKNIQLKQQIGNKQGFLPPNKTPINPINNSPDKIISSGNISFQPTQMDSEFRNMQIPKQDSTSSDGSKLIVRSDSIYSLDNDDDAISNYFNLIRQNSINVYEKRIQQIQDIGNNKDQFGFKIIKDENNFTSTQINNSEILKRQKSSHDIIKEEVLNNPLLKSFISEIEKGGITNLSLRQQEQDRIWNMQKRIFSSDLDNLSLARFNSIASNGLIVDRNWGNGGMIDDWEVMDDFYPFSPSSPFLRNNNRNQFDLGSRNNSIQGANFGVVNEEKLNLSGNLNQEIQKLDNLENNNQLSTSITIVDGGISNRKNETEELKGEIKPL